MLSPSVVTSGLRHAQSHPRLFEAKRGASAGVNVKVGTRLSATMACLLASLVGACSVIPGPKGSAFGAFASKEGAKEDASTTEPARRFAADSIREVLVERGYRINRASRYRVEFGFARRASEIGFDSPQDSALSSAGARARPEARRLDLCREHVFRLSVAILETRSGNITYRGTAERIKCGDLKQSDYLALANVALQALQ